MALDPRANFRITADGSDYKRKLAAALRDTDRFAGSVRQGLRTGALAGAAAVTAATVAIVRMTSEASKAADALAKQSDLLGISTQKLAAYQLAARLSGSSNDGLEKGIRKLQKSIVDATNGLSTYTRAFDALKLSPEELKQLTPDQQFEKLSKAFAGVENQAERVSIAYDLFGGRNTALLNTMVLTGNQLNKLEADTKAWGVAISRVDAKQIENANDAVERGKTAFQGFATNIALALAPLKEDLANSFADAAAEAGGFKTQVTSAIEAVIVGANFAINAVRGIEAALLSAKLAALKVHEAIQDSSSFVQNVNVVGVPVGKLLRKAVGGSLKETREEIYKTEDAIGSLVDRFASGDEAIQRYRKLQADAAARAQEQVAALKAGNAGPQIGGDAGASPVDGPKPATNDQLTAHLKQYQDSLKSETQLLKDAQAEREAIIDEAVQRGLDNGLDTTELKAELAQATADRLTEIERQRIAKEEQLSKQQVVAYRKRIAERESLERKHQAVIGSLREQAVDTAIGLLQTLGARSKTLAIAAIVAEKAVAVSRIIINTNIAAARALAELGPIAGAPVAAAVTAWGYGLAAATAAVGVFQAASVGQGSTGAPLGTPTNPVYTDSDSAQQTGNTPAESSNVNITIYGDVLSEDRLQRVLGNIFSKDGVIISANSRQAATIRGS